MQTEQENFVVFNKKTNFRLKTTKLHYFLNYQMFFLAPEIYHHSIGAD